MSWVGDVNVHGRVVVRWLEHILLYCIPMGFDNFAHRETSWSRLASKVRVDDYVSCTVVMLAILVQSRYILEKSSDRWETLLS